MGQWHLTFSPKTSTLRSREGAFHEQWHEHTTAGPSDPDGGRHYSNHYSARQVDQANRGNGFRTCARPSVANQTTPERDDTNNRHHGDDPNHHSDYDPNHHSDYDADNHASSATMIAPLGA
jgi:hypothetical protein